MKVFSLSLSIIEADNRVIRQCDAISKSGYEVKAFGIKGSDVRQNNFSFDIEGIELGSTGPAGPVTFLQDPIGAMRAYKRNVRLLLEKGNYQKTIKLYNFFTQTVHTLVYIIFNIVPFIDYIRCYLDHEKIWEKIYWKNPTFVAFLKTLDKEDFSQVKLIIANDWQMLPLAKHFSDKYGVKYAYDSHEHALSENNHSIIHKYLKKGFLFQLEKETLNGSSFVTSVSDGILDALKSQYQLSCECFVTRSTPYYHKISYRPVNPEKITVYFHGYLKENRHLDTMIKSLVHLDDNYHLIFRGGHYSSEHYEKQLYALANNLGVAERFLIEPIAMHDQMINLASSADIGLSLPPLNSLHSDMALPNKFFEYVMSGLAVGVSNVKEMGDYINNYDLGLVINDLDPKKIAESISAISTDQINEYKRNSLALAEELNWEKEQKRFISKLNFSLEH